MPLQEYLKFKIYKFLMRQQLHFASSKPHIDVGDLHGNMLVISWIVLANIGLWAHFFKYKSWAIPLHKVAMAILSLLTVMSIFLALVTFGLRNGMPVLHTVAGIIVFILTLLAAGGGALCSIIQASPFFSPFIVKIVRKAHKIAGWAVLVIVLVSFVSTLKKKIFITALVVNLLSYGLFLLSKTFNKKMQNNSMKIISESDNKHANLKQIKTTKDLSYFGKDYFIFADKVYDVNRVITNHPAGWEIIKAIKGRQVDRYLYGIQPLQKLSGSQQVLVHKHTQASMSMMGEPLAKLYSVPFYRNFSQVNSSTIEELAKPCKNPWMYVAYLDSKQRPFEYKGYSELSQLGKYYTVNMEKQTKLYSIVNFLHDSNLKLMERIIGGAIWQKNRIILYNGEVHEIIPKQTKQIKPLLPLLLKKYEKGAFTKQFLSGKCTKQILISNPMGRGLFLHQVSPGLILMLAAGTGVNPFCDLIDLLFKQALLIQRHPLSQQIISNDPILSGQPFTRYQFVLYVSVQLMNELHPLFLYQCNYLCQRNKIKVFVRSKDLNSPILQGFPAIGKIEQRFESVIKQWAQQKNQLSQAYICGTPDFNGGLLLELNKCDVPPYKYKIM